MKDKLTYISLFSSAGVGCYGFKMEDFDCIATNELLDNRLEIQKINNKCKYDTGYISGDITKSATKEKIFKEIDNWKEKEKIKEVDVVVATPPCQGMSSANYKKNNEQKRNSLVVEAIKMIKKINPRIFVFENVRAFMKTICTDLDGQDKTIKESIYNNLGNDYNIYYKVMNFKEYGVPSSRPRTIVIGTRKDLINMSPLNLFPQKQKEITLRESIGELRSLNYGEIDENDIYHFFRKYPRYMEEWIDCLKEGESAFNNPDDKKPYKIIKGEKHILRAGHLGNKFRRLFWNKCCACVATRNDELASLDTIHPTDNRVLSIRELMNVMTIPEAFKWVYEDIESINHKSYEEKEEFLKNNELNIRRCIGEAVPTKIMNTIAKNIKIMIEFEDFLKEYKAKKVEEYLANSVYEDNFYIQSFLYEELLSNKKETGSFYTPQSVVFDSIKYYETKNKNVNILEPAVGLGAFIPQLVSALYNCDTINIDVVDINRDVLEKLKELIQKFDFDDRITINYICDDFLKHEFTKKYNLVITNPTYCKPDKKLLKEYRNQFNENKVSNLYVFFMEKIKEMSNEIILIIPKTFLMAAEYVNVRNMYEKMPIVAINDFGVKYFKKVFVEIISIHFKKNYNANVKIEDKVNDYKLEQPQFYIIHDKCWMLYRNSWFDEYIKKIKLNTFEFFRDREITNKYLKDEGNYRILKSKNILDNGEIVNIEGYDKYINDISDFNVKKYLNSASIIMPNFTYNTRATILPKNTIPNGSIAILIPKNPEEMDNIDLSLYSTAEFRDYYAIVKNKSKFTINIDSSSIYYIGIKKNKTKEDNK